MLHLGFTAPPGEKRGQRKTNLSSTPGGEVGRGILGRIKRLGNFKPTLQDYLQGQLVVVIGHQL